MKYPYKAEIDKDEEFWYVDNHSLLSSMCTLNTHLSLRSFINRFPTVKAHLGGLTKKRELLRRGRIQLRAAAMMKGLF